MKSYKLFILIVVGLIIINCAMLGAFWYQQTKSVGFDGPPRAANTYLIKELKLTASQQKAYEAMRKKHFETTQQLNKETRGLKDEFFDHIKSSPLDTAAAFGIEKKINDLQLALDTTTLFHFREFRKILTPDQQEKFDQVIKIALRMMGGPPHGPPPGGRGPNGGPPPGGGPGDGHGPPPDGMPPPPPGN